MRTRISIGILVLVLFSFSTVMLATQRGESGERAPAVGASSATGSAQDHRHNPSVSTDHKADTTGQKDINGFKNYGQYVAATQVSKHLNIPVLGELPKIMRQWESDRVHDNAAATGMNQSPT